MNNQTIGRSRYIALLLATYFVCGVALAVTPGQVDDFEDATTYRATTSYGFADGGTRLRASVGSGWKPPTFIERYGFFPDSFIGNPGLKPETSTGWDIGFDQQLGQAALDLELSEGSVVEDTVGDKPCIFLIGL